MCENEQKPKLDPEP